MRSSKPNSWTPPSQGLGNKTCVHAAGGRKDRKCFHVFVCQQTSWSGKAPAYVWLHAHAPASQPNQKPGQSPNSQSAWEIQRSVLQKPSRAQQPRMDTENTWGPPAYSASVQTRPASHQKPQRHKDGVWCPRATITFRNKTAVCLWSLNMKFCSQSQCVITLFPALFRKFVRPLGGGAALEETGHWGKGLEVL